MTQPDNTQTETDKKSFILYVDFKPQIDNLTDQQCASLFRCIFDYQHSGSYSSTDPIINFAMVGLISQFKRDNERYNKRCIKNSNNAKARWEKKRMRTDANASNRMRTDAKHADRDRDRDRDINICGSYASEEHTAKPTSSVSDQLQVFLTRFSKETGRTAKTSYTVERQFCESIKLGWTVDQMINAAINASRDKWVKENNVLRPEFITKSENLNKYFTDTKPDEVPKFHGVRNNWAGVEVNEEGQTWVEYLHSHGLKTPLEIKREKEAAALESQSV